MDVEDICKDIEFLISHLYMEQEVAVKRWSNIECEDYQIPIAVIIGFISHAVPPVSRTLLPIRCKPEYEATVEILTNSNLHSVLEFDLTAKSIRYRTGVSDSTKAQLAEYINKNSPRAIV